MNTLRARFPLAILLSCCWVFYACQQVPGDGAQGDAEIQNPLLGWEVVDLTHKLETGAPVYPGGIDFELTTLATLDQGYYINSYSTGEHVGTHVDAPSHFAEGGRHVDQLLPEDLMGPVVLIDLTQEAQADPDIELEVDHLKKWESIHGRIPDNSFVIVNSDWWKRWPNPDEYLNKDDEGVMRFPGISQAAADFLGRERAINGVGIDTLSTDHGSSVSFDQHRSWLGMGKINIENLDNLERIPPAGAFLIVSPIKITGGSGAQARVFALVKIPPSEDTK